MTGYGDAEPGRAAWQDRGVLGRSEDGWGGVRLKRQCGRRATGGRVTLVMHPNETPHPARVGLLGAQARRLRD